ncbi:hypothetical protein NDU88_006435 [Pleurodeles waltl]|uniref:Uncharacterized protein n=1 Tax=Pleurodeles waltl TaxID=8319 RepID=A0AAV7NTG8_PLEWA|nr:hypothetical protein NDU88_006435 [Pleurodeles waltl]
MSTFVADFTALTWRIRPRCVSSGDPPSRTSVSSAVQGPQGPPGRIPSAPETRAFSLRISVDSGRVAPGHEAPHQFDHSSRHFRGRTGRRSVPVLKVGVRYTRGPLRQTQRAARRVGATARLPAAGPPARGSGRFSLLARVGPEGPHAPPVAVTPSSAVSGTQGLPRAALQQPPGRRGATPSPQPRSAGSPSNGARSHAQPRIRSLA